MFSLSLMDCCTRRICCSFQRASLCGSSGDRFCYFVFCQSICRVACLTDRWVLSGFHFSYFSKQQNATLSSEFHVYLKLMLTQWRPDSPPGRQAAIFNLNQCHCPLGNLCLCVCVWVWHLSSSCLNCRTSWCVCRNMHTGMNKDNDRGQDGKRGEAGYRCSSKRNWIKFCPTSYWV